MIFDPQIEFANLENQLYLIGIPEKIESLQNKRSELMKKYEKFENVKILDAVQVIDQDLKLFESIISLWVDNTEKLKRLYESFEGSISEINKGAAQTNLIRDLNTAYNYERDENIILSNTFIKLASDMGMNTTKMDKALKDLRTNVTGYLKHMNKLLNG